MKRILIIPGLALATALAAPQAQASELQTLSFDTNSQIEVELVKKGGGGGKRGFGSRSRGGFGKRGSVSRRDASRNASDFTDNRSRAVPFFSKGRRRDTNDGDTFIERLFQF